VTEKPWLRQVYDGAERRIAPPLEQFVRTDRFAELSATVGQVQGLVTGGIRGATTWFWHTLNLPAGTDVQRLRRQIGALDREVRRLSLQLTLQEAKAESADAPVPEPVEKVDVDGDTPKPVRRARPRAPRGGAQRPPGS
jgi:hypothetical protein